MMSQRTPTVFHILNSPDPCINGGDCQDLVGDYQCNCQAGYEGRICEININEEGIQSLIFLQFELAGTGGSNMNISKL